MVKRLDIFKKSITESERQIFKEALTELGLGLEGRMKTDANFLSGGQRQALTLAMATLVRPKILLLDEHTAALDPKTSDMVMGLTKKVVEEQKLTTLMITHNMEHAIEYGNRLDLCSITGKLSWTSKAKKEKSHCCAAYGPLP